MIFDIHLYKRFNIPVCPSCESMHISLLTKEDSEKFNAQFECYTCLCLFDNPDFWLGQQDLITKEYMLV